MTAAKKLAATETHLETGTVDRILSDVITMGPQAAPYPGPAGPALIEVRSDTGTCHARRAKSCLVAPEIGDTVLCAVVAEGTFVLAVLQGAEGAPTRIAAEGDLHIQAREGRVAVSSPEGIDLVSGGAVSMTSKELHARATSGSVSVEELGFFGRVVQAEVAKIALAAQEVDAALGRLTQRAKRVFRFVEEIDQTRAGTIDLRAQNLVGIRGENAVIAARVLAKIDGEQIHLG